MRLSKQDRSHLKSISDLLLRPFEHVELTDFLKAAGAQMRPLFGAFASVSGVLDAAGTAHVVSDDYPPASVEAFKKWKLADAGTERALGRGVEVVTMRTVVDGEWDLLEQDPMMNEWYYPHHVHDVVAALVRWPEDGAFASLELHHHSFGTPRMGAEGAALLEMLIPSLRAGARLLYTVGEHRLRLARDFDALGVPLCVCGRDGSIAHVATALGDLLAKDPDRERIMAGVRAVAREVARSANPDSGRGSVRPPLAHTVVHTSAASYRLSGTLATHAMQFGATDILVSAGRLTSAPLTAVEIAERHSMTRREAEVAERLGRGDRNADIATALGLSPHTVRRHTERVLAKLGVASRAEAAAHLRR